MSMVFWVYLVGVVIFKVFVWIIFVDLDEFILFLYVECMLLVEWKGGKCVL